MSAILAVCQCLPRWGRSSVGLRSSAHSHKISGAVRPIRTGSWAIQMNSLNDLRTAIDNLDRELLGLLNRRAELAKEIGSFKARSGEAVYSQSREDAVIQRCLDSNA